MEFEQWALKETIFHLYELIHEDIFQNMLALSNDISFTKINDSAIL